MTIANAQDPITEQKRRREVDEAAAQEGEPKEKQRKDETGKAEESHKALKASTRQEGNKASKEKTLPANARHATQRGQSFAYVCPACHQSVISSIRTGQVDHRRTCGNQFQVNNGVVAQKCVVYTCPFCKGLVNSNVKTGKINHRGVCGYKFSVRDGVVAKKRFVYQCPFCNGLVNSNVKTGQIDHRSVCNNQFYVKDGEVSKQTRHQAHSCPVCSTVVWSSLRCHVAALLSSMTCHRENHVTTSSGTFPRKRQRKQNRNNSHWAV